MESAGTSTTPNCAHGPGAREQAHDLLRRGIGGDVIIGRLAAQQQITHAAAYEICLISGGAQCANYLNGCLLHMARRASGRPETCYRSAESNNIDGNA